MQWTASSIPAVREFLRAEIARDQTSGFSLLRRIPSAELLKFLDYFNGLLHPAQEALIDELAELALCQLFPNTLVQHPHAKRGAYYRYVESLPYIDSWRYMDLRLLRLWISEAKRGKAPKVPDEAIQYVESLTPIKAPAIRKQIKAVFADSFGAKPENLGGGEWLYEGQYQGISLEITIDFGGSQSQLRYWVAAEDETRGLRIPVAMPPLVPSTNYEEMFGFGFLGWDRIHQDNLEAAIETLRDLVIYFAELPSRLPSVYKQPLAK